MTRTEAISIITATLPKLDDARIADLAELVRSATEPVSPFRALSDDERAGLTSAREDFKAGRSYSSDEYCTEMDAFMARMKAK